MRIAVVVCDFPVVSQTFIANQIVDLIDKGHELKIFALNENNSPILHSVIEDYNLLGRTTFYTRSKKGNLFNLLVCSIKNRRNINFKKFLKKFKFFRYQQKSLTFNSFSNHYWILKNQNYDIIHAHFGPAGAYMGELLSVGFFAKSKFITTFHGYDLNPGLLPEFKKKYNKIFEEVNMMTVNTIYLKVLLQKITHRAEIIILPVGLDTSLFKKSNFFKKDNLNILFVGRLIKLKGADLAIEIMNRLVNREYQNIKLCIVGDGEMKEELCDLIQKYNLEDSVELMGAKSQDKIVELMDHSDIFLLPGVYDENGLGETQGLVIQEAQAMELPVIVSNVGGMKYGLLDGETGFVVDAGDIKTFVENIEILYNDPDLKKRMGVKGRKFVQENYDSAIIGDQLEDLYIQILK